LKKANLRVVEGRFSFVSADITLIIGAAQAGGYLDDMARTSPARW